MTDRTPDASRDSGVGVPGCLARSAHRRSSRTSSAGIWVAGPHGLDDVADGVQDQLGPLVLDIVAALGGDHQPAPGYQLGQLALELAPHSEPYRHGHGQNSLRRAFLTRARIPRPSSLKRLSRRPSPWPGLPYAALWARYVTLGSSCLAASSALVMECLPSPPGRSGAVHLRMGSNDSTSHYPTLVAEGKRAHNCAVYARRRPAETVHSTALTRRLLTRKWSPHGAWRSSMHGDEGGPRTVVDEALVRTPNFALTVRSDLPQTLRRTAVGCHLLARRSSLGRPWRSRRVSGQLSETGRFATANERSR
jgi:hypothetical protein